MRAYDTRYSDAVTARRKAMLQGDWDWPGAVSVSRNLQDAALKIARSPYGHSCDLHLQTMAVLGCGHEETCKAHQMLLQSYGYIQNLAN